MSMTCLLAWTCGGLTWQGCFENFLSSSAAAVCLLLLLLLLSFVSSLLDGDGRLGFDDGVSGRGRGRGVASLLDDEGTVDVLSRRRCGC